MQKGREQNNLKLSGTVVSIPVFHHASEDKTAFYQMYIECKNTQAGISDVIPVLFSNKDFYYKSFRIGKFVSITGEYRSRFEGEHLILYVFAQKIIFGVSTNQNDIWLSGVICKKPTRRKTPFGKDMSDILLKVQSDDGKQNFIPCIAWYKNAREISGMDIDCKIRIIGAIRSREYKKKLNDGTKETKTAYEVSILDFEEIKEII